MNSQLPEGKGISGASCSVCLVTSTQVIVAQLGVETEALLFYPSDCRQFLPNLEKTSNPKGHWVPRVVTFSNNFLGFDGPLVLIGSRSLWTSLKYRQIGKVVKESVNEDKPLTEICRRLTQAALFAKPEVLPVTCVALNLSLTL